MSVKDFELQTAQHLNVTVLTMCCPVWLSTIYLLCTSVLCFVMFVCLQFLIIFSTIVFVFYHIASYLLSFLCTHSVYSLCDSLFLFVITLFY